MDVLPQGHAWASLPGGWHCVWCMCLGADRPCPGCADGAEGQRRIETGQACSLERSRVASPLQGAGLC